MLGVWIILWSIGYLCLAYALHLILSSEFHRNRHTVKITILCMVLPLIAFITGYLK